MSDVGHIAEAGQRHAEDAGAQPEGHLLTEDGQAEDQGLRTHAAAPFAVLDGVGQHGPEADHIGGGADGLQPKGGEQQRQGLTVDHVPQDQAGDGRDGADQPAVALADQAQGHRPQRRGQDDRQGHEAESHAAQAGVADDVFEIIQQVLGEHGGRERADHDGRQQQMQGPVGGQAAPCLAKGSLGRGGLIGRVQTPAAPGGQQQAAGRDHPIGGAEDDPPLTAFSASAQSRRQRQGQGGDDDGGQGAAHHAEAGQVAALGAVCRDPGEQRGVGNGDHGVEGTEHQLADQGEGGSADRLGAGADEQDDEGRGQQGSAQHQIGTIAAPAAARPVGDQAHDRVHGGVPDQGDHIDQARRLRRQSDDVGVEEQQVELRHLPVQIAAEIAHADRQLATSGYAHGRRHRDVPHVPNPFQAHDFLGWTCIQRISYCPTV
ncbi:hypothetical protein D3C86_854770 [compost metagenome]